MILRESPCSIVQRLKDQDRLAFEDREVARPKLVVEISRRLVRMRFRGSGMPIAPRELPAYSNRLIDPINNGPAATLSGLSG